MKYEIYVLLVESRRKLIGPAVTAGLIAEKESEAGSPAIAGELRLARAALDAAKRHFDSAIALAQDEMARETSLTTPEAAPS